MSKTKRLRKVHFRLPKSVKHQRLVGQALDPKSAPIRHWQAIMLIPLSYETWAFPYRLALGYPSLQSQTCIADLICDSFFVLDMLVSLCTALPAESENGRLGPSDSSFLHIAVKYFTTVFPSQFLPCMLYWLATPICASQLLLLCPDQSDIHATRRSSSTPQQALGDGGHEAAVNRWQCVVASSNLWPVWVWWLACVPRLCPRVLRLVGYFKAMERDLVLARQREHAHGMRMRTSARAHVRTRPPDACTFPPILSGGFASQALRNAC